MEVVRLSVYLSRNARALMPASQLGGEIRGRFGALGDSRLYGINIAAWTAKLSQDGIDVGA
jgi:hypothetical protein